MQKEKKRSWKTIAFVVALFAVAGAVLFFKLSPFWLLVILMFACHAGHMFGHSHHNHKT